MARHRITIGAAGLLTALLVASPAAASPPLGSCAPAFTTATFAEILAEFPPENGSEEQAIAALMGFDNNGNGVICWIAHPPNSRSFETLNLVANVVDDNAAPHD